MKRWASAEGVTVPIQAVYDVMGNLFNVQSPNDLTGALTRRLASLVIPGQAGPTGKTEASRGGDGSLSKTYFYESNLNYQLQYQPCSGP